MARELGDETAIARLSAAAERTYEPRFFGDHGEKFGWWFGLDDGYPRGQMSAVMMFSEIGRGGDWTRVFEAPHMDKFDAPTVEDVDFPSLGIRQAWNDIESGTLYVGTYAGAPARRGSATSWRVTNLPNPDDVFVICDGEPFERFEVEGPGTIRIDADVERHQYYIFTDYRGSTEPTRDAPPARRSTGPSSLAIAGRSAHDNAAPVRNASSEFIADGGPGCSCC